MTFFSSLKLVLIYLFGHYIICEAHGRNFSDTFNEELVLKPLPNGYIFSHFQFTTTWDVQLTDEGACK